MLSSYLAFLISITALTLIQIFPGALAVVVRELPLPADVSLCRPEYGQSLERQDCKDALSRMPLSDKFVTYTNARDLMARIKVMVPLTYESGKFFFNDSVMVASPPMGGSGQSQSYFTSMLWLCLFLFAPHVCCEMAEQQQQQRQRQAHMLTGPLGLHYIGNCKITVDVASGPGQKLGLRDTPTTMRKLAEHVITQCLWAGTGIGGFVTYGLRTAIIPGASVSPNIGSFLTVTVLSRAVTANPGTTDPAVVEGVTLTTF